MKPGKLDVTRFVDHLLSTPFCEAFRVVGGTWWVFRDDFWIIDLGGLRINSVIMNELDDLGYQDTKRYLIDRIRQDLKAQLTTDRLPGRLEGVQDPLEHGVG